MKIGIITSILFAVLQITAPLTANKTGTGSHINWVKGYITSIGVSEININNTGNPKGRQLLINKGRTDAYLEAKRIAIENMVKSLKEIRVDSNKMLFDLVYENNVTRARLSNLINSNVKSKEYPYDFFRSACLLKLKINDLIKAVPYKFPSNDFPEFHDNPIQTEYSSLVIDTRNSGIKPMLFPSVYNEEGLEIYSRYFVDINYAGRNGMVAYVYDEKKAMDLNRAGKRPFFSIALKNLNGSPVISNSDVRKIISSKKTVKNLKKCRVIFIIDRVK